jgi:polyphenol oxidase
MNPLVLHDDGVYRVQGDIPGLVIGVAGRRANATVYGVNPASSRSDEKSLLSRITGVATQNILALDQLHGDTILVVKEPPAEECLIYGEADGLLTELPGICLVIRTADCVPVFVYDRKLGVLGAVHSGWRGTRLGIAGKLVKKMKCLHGSLPGDLSAFILPSIGPASYTVGRDVADLFPGDIREKDGAIYLDLWRGVERSLAGEGVDRENIRNARTCTLAGRDEFFSHRGGDAGRNLNFALMTGRP